MPQEGAVDEQKKTWETPELASLSNVADSNSGTTTSNFEGTREGGPFSYIVSSFV
jgi:hypothetical protein